MKEDIFAVRESATGVMTVHVVACGVKGYETTADAPIVPITSISGVDEPPRAERNKSKTIYSIECSVSQYWCMPETPMDPFKHP